MCRRRTSLMKCPRGHLQTLREVWIPIEGNTFPSIFNTRAITGRPATKLIVKKANEWMANRKELPLRKFEGLKRRMRKLHRFIGANKRDNQSIRESAVVMVGNNYSNQLGGVAHWFLALKHGKETPTRGVPGPGLGIFLTGSCQRRI